VNFYECWNGENLTTMTMMDHNHHLLRWFP
jgi:hypothetical protein